jgi:hypothetical protein
LLAATLLTLTYSVTPARANKASSRATYVFEVANEPNLYPYASPALYAWYYYRWHRLVTARAQAMGIADRVRLMPAGLWITKGPPSSVLQILQAVLEGAAADAELYYRQFLVALGRLHAATPDLSNCLAMPPFRPIPEADAMNIAARFIDIGNLHVYPWVQDTTSLPAPNLAGRFARHFQALDSFARFAAAYSRAKKVWLTEAGNINPFSMTEMVGSFMTPFLAGLESLARDASAPIAHWYWFKAVGEDAKFGLLGKLGAYVDAAAKVPGPVANALGLGKVRELAVSLSALRRQVPLQGLTDNNGQMREFGAVYLRRAGVRP